MTVNRGKVPANKRQPSGGGVKKDSEVAGQVFVPVLGSRVAQIGI
jgi:hypothetical protein